MKTSIGEKTLFVGGLFDGPGRRSNIAHRIFEALRQPGAEYHNGGSFETLENILETIDKHDRVFWFPNIPNDKRKLVKEIKQRNKTCILVTSKRNRGEYSTAELIHHALGNKSNLFVEFSGEERYHGRVIDPLGNVFADYTGDFTGIGRVLAKRTRELASYTRVPSSCADSSVCSSIPEIPDDQEFFSLVRSYGNRFHELIHTKNPSRFLGNASFRCERGFPSMKKEGHIFVSRRDIDKRLIGKDFFVAVDAGSQRVIYHGDHKPSVDTPIQVRLYQHYPTVNYMLHGHVYVSGAPYTDEIIPCGAIEEVDAIKKKFPDASSVNFAVNLRGHGSLVLVDSADKLKHIPYLPRGIEVHEDYMGVRK